LKSENGKVLCSTLDVAERFGKRHGNVVRDVEALECSEDFTQLNFELSYYRDSSSKSNKLYLMTRDGFPFLVMGFTDIKSFRFLPISSLFHLQDQVNGVD
jgi:Rha family phage regulatory protein